MQDFTQNGEFPIASLSSIRLSHLEDVYSQFSRLVRQHNIIENDESEAPSELQYSPLKHMAVSRAHLGLDMVVEFQNATDKCLVFCSLGQPIECSIDNKPVCITKNKMAVLSPGQNFELQVVADGASLMIDIDLDYLQTIIKNEINDELKTPLNFYFNNPEDGEESGFPELIQLHYENIRRGAPEINHKKYLLRFEELLATNLLYSKTNNYSNLLNDIDTEVLPRHVACAIDYIHSHAAEAITLKTLADVAATSQRSLIRGFQKYKNCSPISYLRAFRLDNAKKELLRSRPENSSVTSIANKWGFIHSGRFAQSYFQRFGEYPTDTLRS